MVEVQLPDSCSTPLLAQCSKHSVAAILILPSEWPLKKKEEAIWIEMSVSLFQLAGLSLGLLYHSSWTLAKHKCWMKGLLAAQTPAKLSPKKVQYFEFMVSGWDGRAPLSANLFFSICSTVSAAPPSAQSSHCADISLTTFLPHFTHLIPLPFHAPLQPHHLQYCGISAQFFCHTYYSSSEVKGQVQLLYKTKGLVLVGVQCVAQRHKS